MGGELCVLGRSDVRDALLVLSSLGCSPFVLVTQNVLPEGSCSSLLLVESVTDLWPL